MGEVDINESRRWRAVTIQTPQSASFEAHRLARHPSPGLPPSGHVAAGTYLTLESSRAWQGAVLFLPTTERVDAQVEKVFNPP